jgi:hypothetical protein
LRFVAYPSFTTGALAAAESGVRLLTQAAIEKLPVSRLRLPKDRRRATSPPKPLPRSGFELCQKSDVEIQSGPS